ncbi:GNAT family N-acetyltransferase [Streptomyces sp. CMB-StM0423]|uniref:GNAT family N-acetyltransferase n=1 Tax=Streptomyces sp. CMB-StM0423 TaxID=2059884 RepID=UPI000C70666D|nr:GNAT family N-acetyltransferase [Streptomyces sp. CMB-StM0423]AUH41470.1 GNAT family N-acetyltransferase [Streptomyces sp. CMB-StM0423]
MAEVTVQCYDGAAAAEKLETFLPAYREVYAEPPYCEGPEDVAGFAELFAIQSGRPGFRVALAVDGREEVVGFAYGFRLPPDTGWWRNLLRPPPAEFTAEDGQRTFAVIELAVRKPWRRQGVARRLHAALLDGLAVERVTLTVRPEPEAAPAQAAYGSWGYRKLGKSQPATTAPVYEAMVLQLRPS